MVQITLLDFERLFALAEQQAGDYQNARPFPHAVFDDFISAETVDTILREFPDPDTAVNWRRHVVTMKDGKPAQHGKLGFADELGVGPTIRQMFWELNSQSFLTFLEELSGIAGLIPDPGQAGGGIHQSLPGAVLAVHADFNKHPVTGLDRRLNTLIYLNRDWQEKYGGHIELWKSDMSACVQKRLPIAGRCVIFSTSANSFHGHPQPLSCPEGLSRKSIATYYYTNGRPKREAVAGHPTLWQEIPVPLRGQR